MSGWLGIGLLAAGCLASSLPAAAAAGPAGAEEQAGELKLFSDPTIMKRRAWLETEWNDYREGRSDLEETLGGLYAWRMSSRQDVGVRLKVPYKWHLAGDDPADSDKQGLGDIQTAVGTAFRLHEHWRTAGGVELRMPTAHDGLSDNDWRLQEFGAVAWDATPWLTFSPSVEHNHSIDEVRGGASRHYIESYFPATVLLPHRWSLTAQYENKVDFENDNYVTHSAKLLVAKQLESIPLGCALSLKKSFDSGVKQFQLNFVVTWYFR